MYVKRKILWLIGIVILGEAPHSILTQRTAMLRRWKQIKLEKATYERLCQVFKQCRRADLVEKVQKLSAEGMAIMGESMGPGT